MEQYSDKELIDLFNKSDNKNYAFTFLVNKYKNQIYWHIRRILIDHNDTNDVVQNTFIKIWQNLDKFREDAKLYTWIYRIATNESLNFLKKKRTRLFIPLTDVEHLLEIHLRKIHTSKEVRYSANYSQQYLNCLKSKGLYLI